MKENIFKSALLISVLTIIGKIIGFLRTIIIAYFFGADSTMDAYNLANGFVLNVLYALSTAVGLAFLPMYIEKKVNEGERGNAIFSSKILTATSFLIIVISVLVFVNSSLVAKVIAPGYTGVKLKQVAFYLKILSTGMVFSLLTSLLKSILDAEKVYGYGAFSGIIFSIITILFVILFHNLWGVMSLVISIPIAYFFQFILLGERTRKIVKIRFLFDFQDNEVKNLLKAALPVLLSNTTVEINQLVDRMLASGTKEGAVSALSYSANLSDLVISIFSASLITIFFTEFSNEAVKGNIETIKEKLKQGMRIICFILFPICGITILFGEDIVKIVYFRGAFSNEALSLTTIAVILYATCWIAINIEKLCMKTYLALGDTKTPMVISLIVVMVNIICSIVMVHFVDFAGIVLGTAISEMVAVILNIIFLQKKIGRIGLGNVKLKIGKMLLASFIMGGMLLILKVQIGEISALARFIVATIIGFLVYGFILLLLQSEEIKWILSEIKNRLIKKNII